jgi:hypothetical protein
MECSEYMSLKAEVSRLRAALGQAIDGLKRADRALFEMYEPVTAPRRGDSERLLNEARTAIARALAPPPVSQE